MALSITGIHPVVAETGSMKTTLIFYISAVSHKKKLWPSCTGSK
jgi:hypothetical protein